MTILDRTEATGDGRNRSAYELGTACDAGPQRLGTCDRLREVADRLLDRVVLPKAHDEA